MKWVKDRTGRFPQRPHYLQQEMDQGCEAIVSEFLRLRHYRVDYPVSTDDLTVLIESVVDDLDLYADLSNEAGEVEGVTDFYPGRRPKVRISKRLSSDPRMLNRLRTTLTHELGHVKFHSVLFDVPKTGSLFPSEVAPTTNKCKRDNMLTSSQSDWMEWQAGYACGAFLMPSSAIGESVRKFFTVNKISVPKLNMGSPEADALIKEVSTGYQVSKDAARIRLLQRGTLTESAQGQDLF